MEKDKIATITMITTNIIIWLLISIVLFFFAIIYVSAETSTTRTIFITNKNWNVIETISQGQNYEATANNNLIVADAITTTNGNKYRLNTKIVIDTWCRINCSENTMLSKIRLYNVVAVGTITNIESRKDINLLTSNDVISWYRITINISYELVSNNSTYINAYIINENDEIEGKAEGNTIYNISANTELEILNDINDGIWWNASIDQQINNKLRMIEYTNQYLDGIANRTISINNDMNNKLNNIIGIINNSINGDYTLSNVLRPNTQESLAETGEQAIYTKLGESNVNFTFDQTQIGTGMDFIWTQINNVRLLNGGITTIIGLGLLLGICKQTLGRKNE